MTDAISAREAFNGSNAGKIAATIAPGLAEEPRPSERFACFGDSDRLLVVAGEQEARKIELALPYGLALAAGRRLMLALPEHMSTATRQRVPWLRADARPGLWLHDGHTAEPAPDRDRAETVHSLEAVLKGRSAEEEFRQAATALHLGDRAGWVTSLVDWATRDSRLDPAHRQSERAWHHRGQKVLSMTRSREGVRVVAGIHYSDEDRAPKRPPLTGPMTEAELVEIQEAVGVAVRERSEGDDAAIRRDDEHLLQSVLRMFPSAVDIEQQVMREVPAWRPTDNVKPWARGYIDLMGLDGNGDIVIAETKIEKNADPLFVLQGLDYYIWAQAYRSALVNRLGAAESARIRLNLVVGAHSAAAPRIPRYTAALARALDENVIWSAQLIRNWAEPDASPIGEHLDLIDLHAS